MSSTPDPQEAAALSQLIAQIAKSNERISRLSKETTTMENTSLSSLLQEKDLWEEKKAMMKGTDVQLKTLGDELTACSKRIMKIALRFRELVKKEALEELDARIDKWPVEEYITKEHFQRLLDEALTSHH